MYKRASQMIYNEETERYELNGDGLHCGETLEVLVWFAEKNMAKWVPTRMEYAPQEMNDDGSWNGGWYLVGLSGLRPAGLFARR